MSLKEACRIVPALSFSAVARLEALGPPDSEYSTPKAEAGYTAGEDYSRLQFVGMKGNGIARATIRTRPCWMPSTGC